MHERRNDAAVTISHLPGIVGSGDEADTEGEHKGDPFSVRDSTVNFRDFGQEHEFKGTKSPENKQRKKRTKKKSHKTIGHGQKQPARLESSIPAPILESDVVEVRASCPHVGFVSDVHVAPETSPKRPFNIRGMSVRGGIPAMPMATIPRMLSSTVFSAANSTGLPTSGYSTSAGGSRSLRQTKSLTDLRDVRSFPPSQQLPLEAPISATHPSLNVAGNSQAQKHISRTSAIILLIVSTGLVAVCAEFLVDNISYLIENTSVSEAFIGLIVLPIIGNAAEHVTAVVVAGKNKMDLAIGVAVGSSIQIALFVTPVIVLLGWILAKDMGLYFSLFETVSLFVSAFIVNFLVLDGRSNYLEGALLIAAYVIIALGAFFYPESSQQSMIGGAPSTVEAAKMF